MIFIFIGHLFYIMIKKGHLITLALLVLWGCGQNTNNHNASDSTQTPTVDSTKKAVLTGPTIGDRINGPANIRASVNGKVLFSLNDLTLVDCTDQTNGWYHIAVAMQLEDGETDTTVLKKGRKIIAAGQIVGEIKEDMQPNGPSYQDKEDHTIVELIGYTFKDNLYPNTVIENALPAFLAKTPNPTKAAMQPFIDDFKLQEEAESFKPFVGYYNYENAIEDPSPGFRTMLVFDKDKLIAVVHSRYIDFKQPSVHADRNFSITYMPDVSQATQDKFTKIYNTFIDSVD